MLKSILYATKLKAVLRAALFTSLAASPLAPNHCLPVSPYLQYGDV